MRRVINEFSAYFPSVRIEGDYCDWPPARFREQDETSVNFGNPERRSRGIGELDTAHRPSSDSEQRDMVLRVSVLHCPWAQEMQWGIAEFRGAFN